MHKSPHWPPRDARPRPSVFLRTFTLSPQVFEALVYIANRIGETVGEPQCLDDALAGTILSTAGVWQDERRAAEGEGGAP